MKNEKLVSYCGVCRIYKQTYINDLDNTGVLPEDAKEIEIAEMEEPCNACEQLMKTKQVFIAIDDDTGEKTGQIAFTDLGTLIEAKYNPVTLRHSKGVAMGIFKHDKDR